MYNNNNNTVKIPYELYCKIYNLSTIPEVTMGNILVEDVDSDSVINLTQSLTELQELLSKYNVTPEEE